MAVPKPGRRANRPKRQPAQRILVVTEGTRTEPQYVEGLNRYLRSRRNCRGEIDSRGQRPDEGRPEMY